MNIKQNEKFFTKSNLLVYISIAIMVLGGACFFKRWLIAIGCVILAIGAALFIVFSAKRVSEKEVRACLERKLEGMDYSFDTLGVNERRVIRTIAPLVTEYFEYDEGVMVKQTQNDYLSSKYTKSIIFFLTDALVVRTRNISLISDDDKNRRIEIPYSQIKDISVVRETKNIHFLKKNFSITTDVLLIKYGTNFKFSTPLHVDIKSKDVAEKIVKTISEIKEKAEK